MGLKLVIAMFIALLVFGCCSLMQEKQYPGTGGTITGRIQDCINNESSDTTRICVINTNSTITGGTVLTNYSSVTINSGVVVTLSTARLLINLSGISNSSFYLDGTVNASGARSASCIDSGGTTGTLGGNGGSGGSSASTGPATSNRQARRERRFTWTPSMVEWVEPS